MAVASHGGMLSSGVLLPDKMFIGMAINMYSKPSCGIDRATVEPEPSVEELTDSHDSESDHSDLA